MTKEELREIQGSIKFDAESMAACLGISVRSYRNYLYGVNTIPDRVVRRAIELKAVCDEFDATAPVRIDARISKEFPNGIISEIKED